MNSISIKKIAFLLAINCFIYSGTIAQTNYATHKVGISLTGTSSIHDWEMKADDGNSEARFTLNDKDKIVSLSKLSFSLPAESLKSGHTGMDKNTYKALKTTSNPNIAFLMSNATVTNKSANNYQFECVGIMTIAGTAKQTTLVATAVYNPTDKSLTVTGVKKMKMTDYNVKPPTVMLGAIKTGDDISIAYNLTFNK